MKKDIYIIKNTINDKVYIGQSVNAAERWMKHLSDVRKKPDNQIIHRAMKKYGVENFYYQILEYQIENYDEREKYWISKYNSLAPNGYNVAIGGQGTGSGIESPSAKLNKKQLDSLIKDLIETDIPLNTLEKKYNLCQWSMTEINNGRSYYNPKLKYPLRDTSKYSLEKVKQIKYSLKYELDKSLADIAKEYDIDYSNLNDINYGRIHRYNNETYPLRKGKVKFKTIFYIDEIIDLLKNSSMTQSEIAKKFNISSSTICSINLGKSYRKEGIEYPIRDNYQHRTIEKRTCFTPNEVREIEDKIKNSSYSMRQIGKMYGCSVETIIQMNIGAIKKYRQKDQKYPLRNK